MNDDPFLDFWNTACSSPQVAHAIAVRMRLQVLAETLHTAMRLSCDTFHGLLAAVGVCTEERRAAWTQWLTDPHQMHALTKRCETPLLLHTLRELKLPTVPEMLSDQALEMDPQSVAELLAHFRQHRNLSSEHIDVVGDVVNVKPGATALEALQLVLAIAGGAWGAHQLLRQLAELFHELRKRHG